MPGKQLSIPQVRKNYRTDADFSAARGKIVKLASDTDIDLSGVGASNVPIGVLGDDVRDFSSGSGAGQVDVIRGGEAYVKVGAAGVTAGAFIASDASGLAVDAASGDYYVGQSTEAGSSGQYVVAIINIGGKL